MLPVGCTYDVQYHAISGRSLLAKIVHERIRLLRSRGGLPGTPPLHLLPNLQRRHQLLKLLPWDNPPAGLLVPPRERLPQPRPQRRVRRPVRQAPQDLDDVDRRIAGPGAPGHAAREVDHAGEVALVGNEHHLQLGGLQVAGPARGDDGVDLGAGADAEDGDPAVGGEPGRRVGAPLDLAVDLFPRCQEGAILEQVAGARRGHQRRPGSRHVVRRGSSRRVDEGDGIVDGFLGVHLEGGLHIGERRLPLQRVAEIAVGAHGTEPVTRPRNLVMQLRADVKREERRGRHGRRVARRDMLGALGEVVLEGVVMVDDQGSMGSAH